MLSDNIKNIRKAKGLSQNELAIKLNVVRQTISKWEKGLSVPDSEMIIRIAEVLEISVNDLLGETIESDVYSELKVIANKLEVINEQIMKRNESRRKTWRVISVIVFILAACVLFVSRLPGHIFSQFMINVVGVGVDISLIDVVGTDGPTDIYVSPVAIRPVLFVVSVILYVISVIGICKTRKN